MGCFMCVNHHIYNKLENTLFIYTKSILLAIFESMVIIWEKRKSDFPI